MKHPSLIALAVAGVFAWPAGALAGGTSGHSVQTPSSVSESAPLLIGEPVISSSSESGATAAGELGRGDMPVGAGSSVSGAGSIEFESDASASASTDYWRMGEASSETGAASSVGASGSVEFDAASSAAGTD